MNIALRKPRMTREAFLDWAEAQEARYEFDGFEPVAMTGGTMGHSQITLSIHRALFARLQGSGCRPLGPDAGVATIGDAVRYPDALVTCSPFRPDDRLAPNPVVVFEVLSLNSGRTDRILKVREYQAVTSILRYVLLERTSVAATVFQRSSGSEVWTASTVVAGETLRMTEIGIEVPLDEFYEDTGLVGEPEPSQSSNEESRGA